jgi:hypothetical protein
VIGYARQEQRLIGGRAQRREREGIGPAARELRVEARVDHAQLAQGAVDDLGGQARVALGELRLHQRGVERARGIGAVDGHAREHRGRHPARRGGRASARSGRVRLLGGHDVHYSALRA